MDKQFTAQDILNAKDAYLYANNILYIVDKDDEAYGFNEGGSKWYHKSNFWDYFESSLMMTFLSHLTLEEAAQLYLGWIKAPESDSQRLNRAIKFATDRHAGQFRKGTVKPYIIHPLEALQILGSMNADTNQLIAGVLHDTVEDTNTTVVELRELFGEDVAALVNAHSEDKSKTWQERKQHAIDELKSADRRLRMIVMADKLANLRSMVMDYQKEGDCLWNRFNRGVNDQAWYYSGIIDALFDMQFDPDCAKVYWEMNALYKDLFVSFYINKSENRLYQVDMSGEKHFLKKGDPSWNKRKGALPKNIRKLPRWEAERLEDHWNMSFWRQIDKDLEDADYHLYSGSSKAVSISVRDKKLELSGEHWGADVEEFWGHDVYEYSYSLDEDATKRFFTRLRMLISTSMPLDELLTSEFGGENGSSRFAKFCNEQEIPTVFYSY